MPVKLILKSTLKQGLTVCFSALPPVLGEAGSTPWDKASRKKQVPDALGSSWVGVPATPAPASEPSSFSPLPSQEYVSIHGAICTQGRDTVLQTEDVQEGTSKEAVSLGQSYTAVDRTVSSPALKKFMSNPAVSISKCEHFAKRVIAGGIW